MNWLIGNPKITLSVTRFSVGTDRLPERQDSYFGFVLILPLRSQKIRLKPNKAQETLFLKHCGYARVA